MKILIYIIISIVVIISFIFFMQYGIYDNIVNAQTTEENEIIEDTVEKATSGIAGISKAMKNASEFITNSIETKKGDHSKDSLTLEQLKLAQKLNQEELESSYDTRSKLIIDVGLPPIDFSKVLKESQSLIEVEYQSAYSVVLRGDEKTSLLLNRTFAPFWYAIDIVKKHGYHLKEIVESGMRSQGNKTKFYAILEK